MFGRKYQARIAELEIRIDRLVEQRNAAVQERDAHRFTRRVVERQLAEADAALKRLHGRNRHLSELMELTQEGAERTRLERRIDRLKRVCKRYHAALTGAQSTIERLKSEASAARQRPLAAENTELRRRLGLAEQARRSLEARCAQLQAANEAIYRRCRCVTNETPKDEVTA